MISLEILPTEALDFFRPNTGDRLKTPPFHFFLTQGSPSADTVQLQVLHWICLESFTGIGGVLIMRNIYCAQYPSCLTRAAKEDMAELPCEQCPHRDDQITLEETYDFSAMVSFVSAVFRVRWA